MATYIFRQDYHNSILIIPVLGEPYLLTDVISYSRTLGNPLYHIKTRNGDYDINMSKAHLKGFKWIHEKKELKLSGKAFITEHQAELMIDELNTHEIVKKMRISKNQKEVEAFNIAFKVGDSVRIMKDNGAIEECTVKHPASILTDHTPVVWLKEISGCYALERVIK